MRFTLDQPSFEDGLRTVGRAVSARNTIPVLSGIYLETRGQELRLKATDLEVSVSCTIAADVSAEGAVVLPGRYLQELVRRLPAGPVAVSGHSANVTARIAWDESECTVHGFPAEQFPADPPAGEQAALTVACGALRTLLRETGFATGHDESRPWFTGVFLALQGEKLFAMATDAAIVAYSEAIVHNPGELSFSVILPGRSLQELSRLLAASGEETCHIEPRQNQFRFEIGSVALTTRLLEGQYPDFRRLLPQAYPTRVKMEHGRLLAACERASLMADQSAIRVEATDQGLAITARTPELGEVAERLPASLQGPAFAVPLNVRYVLEGLKSMTGPDVLIEFATARSAVRFRAAASAASFFAVLPLLSF